MGGNRLGYLVLVLMTFPFMILYLVISSIVLFSHGYSPSSHFFAVLLIIGDTFFALQTSAYLYNFYKAQFHYPQTIANYYRRYASSRVAVFIMAFNEPAEIIERTVTAVKLATGERGRVFLLDDSTNVRIRESVKEIAKNYDVAYVHRENRRGAKAGAINDAMHLVTEEYLAVFDSDQRPSPEFFDEILPLLEDDGSLAYVQVPQVYVNTDASRMASAAQSVQALFFDYIAEGKSVSNAMFTCGSNVVYRVAALSDVGNFDETIVTEDMATAINMHARGWKSLYYNKKLVFGEGPSTLAAYFTQQGRWSLGSISLWPRVIKLMLRHPKRMKASQYWEYLNSTSWYLVGFANMFVILPPLAYVFLGIPPVVGPGILLFYALVPYLALSMTSFFLTMRLRGHGISSAILNISLNFVCFPVYLVSAVYALTGRKKPFKVTPKGQKGGKEPLIRLWPQLSLLFLLLLGAIAGLAKYLVDDSIGYAISSVWLIYVAVWIFGLFYVNSASNETSIYTETLKVYSK